MLLFAGVAHRCSLSFAVAASRVSFDAICLMLCVVVRCCSLLFAGCVFNVVGDVGIWCVLLFVVCCCFGVVVACCCLMRADCCCLLCVVVCLLPVFELVV